MAKEIKYRLTIFLLIFFISCGIGAAQGIHLSSQEISWIGEKVFENECASKDECLVAWNESERYHNKGWGLLQVLDGMNNEDKAPNTIEEFVRSADKILADRVANAPQGRNEQKWLPGWQKRVNSYLKQ